MAGESSNILREYLVSLGFKIDGAGKKKAEDAFIGLDLKALSLAKNTLKVAAAVQAMVAVFAYQMEKMYYASKRADTTVGNLQAIEYGAKQVGISSGTMANAVQSVAMKLRSNPGLVAFVQGLGVKVDQDGVKRMHDLIDVWAKMPFPIASRQAAMFGIGEADLYMMIEMNDEMKKQEAIRAKMSKDMGIDPQKAAEAGKEYAKSLTELWARIGLVNDALSLQFLGSFREMTSALNRAMSTLAKMIMEFKGMGPLIQDFIDGLSGNKNNKSATAGAADRGLERILDFGSGNRAVWNAGKSVVDFFKNPVDTSRGWIKPWMRKPSDPARIAQKPVAVARPVRPGVNATEAEKQARFRELEQMYGLPHMLLSGVRHVESADGKNVGPSSKGALGDFQFMKGTGKEYGLENDADRLDWRKSSRAAARYLSKLMQMFNGDMRSAVSAYNWGEGNVQRRGLGSAPLETRKYARDVEQYVQHNAISVTGVTSPQETANSVADVLRESNADMIRQLSQRSQ
jgi:hypothetical protein